MASRYISRERPRVCTKTMAAPAAATTDPSAGSYRRPLMSFTTVTPASMAARATSAL